MINRIIFISVVLAQLVMFSSVVFSGVTRWDQAEVNRLEKSTFEMNDVITDANLESDNYWVKEFESRLSDDDISYVIGLTISEYE